MRVLNAGDSINAGLQGFWPLDEAGGAIARDISPYNRNGRRNDTTAIAGLYGKAALTTGGATSSLSISNLTVPASTPLTVTWAGLYPDPNVDNSSFGAGTGTSSSPRLLVHWPFRGTIYWDYGNDGTGRITTSASGFENQWHVWSFVNDGTGRKEIWKDGVRVASSGTTSALGTSFAGVWFGAGPGGNYLNTAVRIAACRIHFRALAPSELIRIGRDPWAGTLRFARRSYDIIGGSTSGSGSSAGVASATGVGRVLVIGSGSSAGIASPTATGLTAGIGSGSSAGVASVAGTGQTLGKGVANSAGVAAATAEGLALAIGAGLSPGSAAAAAAGLALGIGSGSSTGTAAVDAAGRTVLIGVGAAAGLATVSGRSPGAVNNRPRIILYT